jgi:hypothetical protein
MYTVKNLSSILHVSKATIYNDFKRFKAEIKPYLKTKNHSKYLTSDGLEILKKLRGIQVGLESNLNDPYKSLLLEQVDSFKVQVEYLKNQLEIQQQNLEREQQLHEHTQILLKQSQENILLLETEKKVDKISFWKKFLK